MCGVRFGASIVEPCGVGVAVRNSLCFRGMVCLYGETVNTKSLA